ncbi:hypothetical protein PGIGA_G00176410 [Pangasianodon gigas]|uniref:Uncharacterized protein n=1 Tax=Pangasianodon gigas TaxID=30993 RepID=A0ACC5XV85_PANGG|nr:hypothetical protein [Pangasianodon gigas]
MGPRGLLFWLALCLVLVRIYSINVLETMEDLKKITNFGKHFPQQGLVLLCWLLSQGKFDQNGKLRLNFNPAEERFGIHEYRNDQLTFPSLSNTDFLYFTLGNLKIPNNQLPNYITRIFSNSRGHPKRNVDRVMIQIQKNDPTVVDKVYITQHSENKGSDYDEDLTYLIGKELLKKILELCRPDGDSSNQKHDDNDHQPDHQRFQQIQSMFQKAPYLHEFLYLAGYNPPNNVNQRGKYNCPAKYEHSELENIKLELRSKLNGQARIVWEGIPVEMLKKEMKIGIYNDEDEDNPLVEYSLNGRAYGEIDTHLALNRGLHLRLLKPMTIFETVYESPGFDDSEIEKDHTVARETVEKSHPFFTFNNLFSLVISPFSNLFSLVFLIFSNVFSLVYFIVSSLFSLVYFIVSSLFSLVYFIVSSLLSLVYFTVSSLLSLVYITVSNFFSLLFFICQEILFALGKLISLVFSVCFNLVTLLLTALLIEIVRRAITEVTDNRPRAAPPIVVVSHGRPGF